ncbi:diacylglycerol kinase [Nitratireductor aestuarii]|uniref:Diacylglycerol kinase n=2 Tax=Nitratireductor aestuarii TaxID=1735103 RepID=A0A916RI65_9HYPH|nr:diacylglycerol kinase [Nitratireductor aestuarii]
MGPGRMIKLIYSKFRYSVDGIHETWLTEPSFRQWLALVLLSDICALLFLTDGLRIMIIIGSGFLLLASELINTAVEAAVDLVTKEEHVLAKKAKDAASATTLLTFLTLVSSWLLVLFYQ